MLDRLNQSAPSQRCGGRVALSMISGSHTETSRFVAPRTPIDDLIEMFLALESPTPESGARSPTGPR